MSHPCGAMGWSVIVAFPGHKHFHFWRGWPGCSFRGVSAVSLDKIGFDFFMCQDFSYNNATTKLAISSNEMP